MSMKTWRSLEPADQNVFRNAARDTSMFLRSQWKKQEASFRKQALDVGVTVIEIDQKPLASRVEGPLHESSDGFALERSCRVHPERPVSLGRSFGRAVPIAVDREASRHSSTSKTKNGVIRHA